MYILGKARHGPFSKIGIFVVGSHRKYKYEIVEIVSDYVVDVGVLVGYLDKVSRFVSLFQRMRPTEVGTFFVKPNELYKFSHQIPSFKMTGTEREGVPSGSFELNPASLPLSSDDIWYPVNVKEDHRTTNSEPVENVLSEFLLELVVSLIM